MAQARNQTQEPLRELIMDYTGLAFSRHLQALQAAGGGAPFSGPVAAIFAQFCERPYLSQHPKSETMRDRLFARFFRPAD